MKFFKLQTDNIITGYHASSKNRGGDDMGTNKITPRAQIRCVDARLRRLERQFGTLRRGTSKGSSFARI